MPESFFSPSLTVGYVLRIEKRALKKLNEQHDNKISKQRSKKVIGFSKLSNCTTGFLVPIFTDYDDINNHKYYTQIFGDKNIIEGFELLDIEEDMDIIRVSNNLIFNIEDEGIYGYQFAEGDIIFGNKEELSKMLKSAKHKLQKNLFRCTIIY